MCASVHLSLVCRNLGTITPSRSCTVSSVAAKLGKIRAGLADPLLRITAENKDLRGSDHLATHDLAIRKYKHQPQRDPTYRPPVCIFVS